MERICAQGRVHEHGHSWDLQALNACLVRHITSVGKYDTEKVRIINSCGQGVDGASFARLP